MFKPSFCIIIFIVFLFAGCAGVNKTSRAVSAPLTREKNQLIEKVVAKEAEAPKPPPVKKGVIFAKTDFQGILQTTYVKLVFENLDHTMDPVQLNIGNKPETIWEGKAVQPGYFFLELPAGKYRIVSISIPIGSTLASEQTRITFEVVPSTVSYIGTLKVIGTKETIKLGGLPVIQPGFEYKVEVLDERDEGIAAFRKIFPNIRKNISVQLLKH